MMKKIILICLSICICIFCTGCAVELNEQQYKEAEQKIYDTFGKEIISSLKVYGIEDLDLEVIDIYFNMNADYEYEFAFKTLFTSKSIDKYSTITKNDDNAKELFTILQLMCEKYQDFIAYEIPWEYEGEEINLSYDFDFYDFKIKGEKHTYTYDFHTSSYQELKFDDTVMYENYVNIYANSIIKPSDNKNSQAYYEGYYNVLENSYYDYERYDTDDYYHMGVDDPLIEIDEDY